MRILKNNCEKYSKRKCLEYFLVQIGGVAKFTFLIVTEVTYNILI